MDREERTRCSNKDFYRAYKEQFVDHLRSDERPLPTYQEIGWHRELLLREEDEQW